MCGGKRRGMFAILIVVNCLFVTYLNYFLLRVQKSGYSFIFRHNNATDHDRWIVVTSVQHPTDDIKYLMTLPGWKVVVVGDTKSPANWSVPGCHFLSISTQENLGLGLSRRLPYRSYTRKNLGYLFAIAHGAKFVYETDDDNRPLDALRRFHYTEVTRGLQYRANGSVFNPYRHFGQSTLWPRGAPLSSVGLDQDTEYLVKPNWKTPLIQQGLVNGDPDMDAIFRLTRKKTFEPLDVRFDLAAPPVFLPPGTFSPFNSQNTLFHYKAFWALFLPTTTTFRMCDIWRGYWAQRLLWEIDGSLGFYPPNAYQRRNAHSYMDDANGEKDMYFETDRLIRFLSDWVCPEEKSFFECVVKLTFDMAHDNFWKKEDASLVQLWLQDLLAVGYVEPNRTMYTYPDTRLSRTVHHRINGTFYCGEENTRQDTLFPKVRFVPHEQIAPSVMKNSNPSLSSAKWHLIQLLNLCPNMTIQSLSLQGETYFQDVLLIVIFNWPRYKNMDMLEAIYRPVFPHIAYCGYRTNEFMRQSGQLNVTFIEVPHYRGWYGYMCTMAAIDMGYNVAGYFIVNDDNIVNVWNFQRFFKDQIWRDKHIVLFNVTEEKSRWYWFRMNKKLFLQTMDEFKMLKNKTFPGETPDVTMFQTNLDKYTHGLGGMRGYADIYYLPKRLVPSFYFYIRPFCKHKVFLEIAIPTVLHGLEGPTDNVGLIDGKDLWSRDRKKPFSFYTPFIDHVHPVKLSHADSKTNICKHFVKHLLSNRKDENKELLLLWKGGKPKGERIKTKTKETVDKNKEIKQRSPMDIRNSSRDTE